MDQMSLPVGGAVAAMQDLLDVVEMAIDGACMAGMPMQISSLSIEGLDGNGTVTVSGVGLDGTKFSADVDLSEELGEEDAAPPADAAAPAPAPAAGAAVAA